MTAAAVLGLLVVHNLVTNLWVTERWYVPVNLATAGVLVALAGGQGIGLTLGGAPAVPVAVGLAGALVVVGVVAVVAVMPATRPLLADQRMAGVDARGTAWRVLGRIPLGTVVLEEVAFRGVLPALLSPAVASALFGMWHVLPTMKTLDANGIAGCAAARAWAVAGAVAFTTVVGTVFWELRAATGSLLAPALVHAAANGGATVASYRVLRSAASEGAPRGVAAADPSPYVAAEQAEEQTS